MTDIIIPAAPRTYAHIVNATVVELFTTAHDITHMFPASMTWIDVTNYITVPSPGYTYTVDPTTKIGTFAAPVVVTVTKIPGAQFLARFTSTEMTSIVTAGMSNANILAWFVGLSAAGATVELTSAALKTTLDTLVTANALTAARETTILQAA